MWIWEWKVFKYNNEPVFEENLFSYVLEGFAIFVCKHSEITQAVALRLGPLNSAAGACKKLFGPSIWRCTSWTARFHPLRTSWGGSTRSWGWCGWSPRVTLLAVLRVAQSLDIWLRIIVNALDIRLHITIKTLNVWFSAISRKPFHIRFVESLWVQALDLGLEWLS